MKQKKAKTKPVDQRNKWPIYRCLNMIVKNESKVIKRCLDNHKGLIEAVAIVDTGSTDDTISIIEEWGKQNNIPTSVIVDLWRDDFGYSRTKAIEHGMKFVEELSSTDQAYKEVDWYLMFGDADDLVYFIDGTLLPSSDASIDKNEFPRVDLVHADMRSADTAYSYTWMIRVDKNKPFMWYDPRHEYLSPKRDAEGKNLFEYTSGKVKTIYIESRREGARSNDSIKYLRDAIAFERELLVRPHNDRLLYYLAQSYRDAATMFDVQANEERKVRDDDKQEKFTRDKAGFNYNVMTSQAKVYRKRAEEAYLYRASVNPFHTWHDEYTYLAWLEAAKIRIHRKGYDEKTIMYLGRACEVRAHRMEAPYLLMKYFHDRKMFVAGWNLVKRLVDLPYPANDIIFVDKAIHQYLFPFEASLCAYYANDRKHFAELSKRVIENASTPEHIRNQAKKNLEF